MAPNGRMLVFDEVAGWPPMCLAVISTASDSDPLGAAEALAREYEGRRPGLEGLDRVVSRAVTLDDLGPAGGDGNAPRGGETDDANGRPEGAGQASAADG